MQSPVKNIKKSEEKIIEIFWIHGGSKLSLHFCESKKKPIEM
jgi:hypothetical protein